MSPGQKSAYHMTLRSLHIKAFSNNKNRGRAPYAIGNLVILEFHYITFMEHR